MPFFYRTTIIINFKKYKIINNTYNFDIIRTESVTSTGDTFKDSEYSAMKEAVSFMTNNPDEKITFEIQTNKIKYKKIINT
jgi:hypothetical protein